MKKRKQTNVRVRKITKEFTHLYDIREYYIVEYKLCIGIWVRVTSLGGAYYSLKGERFFSESVAMDVARKVKVLGYWGWKRRLRLMRKVGVRRRNRELNSNTTYV